VLASGKRSTRSKTSSRRRWYSRMLSTGHSR
jgi:hypothetical protein